MCLVDLFKLRLCKENLSERSCINPEFQKEDFFFSINLSGYFTAYNDVLLYF